jgi:hypothetical protein
MSMSIPYFERRLSATLRLMVTTRDAGARLAHAGLARGYGGLIADLMAEKDIFVASSGTPITKPNAIVKSLGVAP